MIRTSTIIAVALLVGACTPNEGRSGTTTRQPPMEAIRAGIEADATCQELFNHRNRMDPSDPDVERANKMFRDIGCFSSSSERTDR